MAKMQVLNDAKLKAAKKKDKPYTLTDGHGLVVLVQPTGAKLWYYKYNFDGRPRQMALGPYPVVTLVKARELHMEARRKLISGVDPSAERQQAKAAEKAKDENSFASVAKLWFEHWKVHKSALYVTNVNTRLRVDIFPVLGAMAIDEIEAPALIKMVEKIEARGVTVQAKRALGTCGQIFRYGRAHGYTKRNPANDVVKTEVLKPHRVKNVARVNEKELPALLRAVDAYNGVITRMAMQLMALTFVRPNELLGAPWEEFNFEKAKWLIPRERMKKILVRNEDVTLPHWVPLSRQAIEILKTLRQLSGGSPMVFPGQKGKAKHLTRAAILKALESMGYGKRMTGHGFRGVASTILHENKFTHSHIEAQLAHLQRGGKVSAAYNYAEYIDSRIEMMQWYADHLDEQRKVGAVISIAA